MDQIYSLESVVQPIFSDEEIFEFDTMIIGNFQQVKKLVERVIASDNFNEENVIDFMLNNINNQFGNLSDEKISKLTIQDIQRTYKEDSYKEDSIFAANCLLNGLDNYDSVYLQKIKG